MFDFPQLWNNLVVYFEFSVEVVSKKFEKNICFKW